jgi:hypothetical protein
MTSIGATMSGHGSITINEKKRAPKNRKKTHHPLGGLPLKFRAIDGEGFTDDDGIHRYKLLGIGQDQISNPHGLEWVEVLSFLYDHFEKGTVYAGFFLGYDFTQWFRQLPEERARMLLTIEGRNVRKRKVTGNHAIAPHPVEYAGWQFDILGTKRLRIRPKRCDCTIQSCKCKPKAAWMYVCDVGGFFQSSFLNVIDPSKWDEPIVTDEEYAIILEGKAARSDARLDARTALYNRLENEILERVLARYAEGLEAADVRLTPSKWFGPGQAAQEWMRGRAPTRESLETLPDWKWFSEFAAASYFGGWFEIMMHGLIEGLCYEYDINSAYPAIIAKLPCLLHGTFERGTGKPPASAEGRYTLIRARVWTQAYAERRKHHHIGAMLHRDAGGRISRPLMTEGWYWQHELDAARRAKCITRITDDRYMEWCSFIAGQCPSDCHPFPMREVERLYLQRLAVGKDTPFGKGAKNIYNSMYGKFAQSVGNPLYGNPVYASLITAGCRTMILDAIASHPKGKANVAMVATDAVFFLDPHPGLSEGKALGQWERKTRSCLTLFKPGVYWDDDARDAIARGEIAYFKARGINAAAFSRELARIDGQFRAWNGQPASTDPFDRGRSQRWPGVEYRPTFVMKTALQALIQGNWDECGAVTQGDDVIPVKQSSNPQDKRCDTYFDPDRGLYRSEPHWFGEGCGVRLGKVDGTYTSTIECASTPYEKKFGAEDPFSDESKEKWGVTPDGYVGDAFRDILLRGEGPPADVIAGQSSADES